MDILLGVLAGVLAIVIAMAILAFVLRSPRTHRRDLRIVDMRNRGSSVSEIAAALNTTEKDVRETMKRIAARIGPTTAGPG